jgi:hypothetical protein
MKTVGTLSREMYDAAAAAHAAYTDARAMSDRLGAADAALKARIDSIAPPAATGARRGFGGPPQAAAAPTLQSVQSTLLAAAMSMQNADVAPTARQLDGVAKARAQYNEVMSRWRAATGKKPGA